MQMTCSFCRRTVMVQGEPQHLAGTTPSEIHPPFDRFFADCSYCGAGYRILQSVTRGPSKQYQPMQAEEASA